MSGQRGTGPAHAWARCCAQESAVRDLVAGNVAEARAAGATASCDLAGSMASSLRTSALPVVQALDMAGAPTLLPAMLRVVNTAHHGLVDPEAALLGWAKNGIPPTGQTNTCRWAMRCN